MSRWVRHLWLGIKLGRGLNHHQGCFWFFFGKAKDQKQTYCWNCDGISWRFDVHTFKCLHQLEQGTVYSILLAGTIAEYYRCVRIELNLWVKASLQLPVSGEISRKIGMSLPMRVAGRVASTWNDPPRIQDTSPEDLEDPQTLKMEPPSLLATVPGSLKCVNVQISTYVCAYSI